MKNQSIVVGLVLLMSPLIPNHLFAQNPVAPMSVNQTVTMAVTGSALIKVMPLTGAGSTAVTLTLGGPASAGEAATAVKEDVSTRLRISSLATTDPRKITAVLTSGNMLLSHTKLELELATPANVGSFVNYISEGNGITGLQTLGSNAGNSLSAVTLVDNILTCWSGTADGDGYVIHYKYSTDGVGTTTSTNVVVTFTIEANGTVLGV